MRSPLRVVCCLLLTIPFGISLACAAPSSRGTHHRRPANQTAHDATTKDESPKGGDAPKKAREGWSVIPAADGGFAALFHAEQIQTPVAVFDPATRTYSVDPDHVQLRANYKYDLNPALSVGVLFWYQSKHGDLGLGFGSHVVFVPENGATRPHFALTLNAGQPDTHAFVGIMFAASDRVQFPDGRRSIIVPSGTIPNYVTQGTNHYQPQFYAGIVILGKSLTAPPASESTGEGDTKKN